MISISGPNAWRETSIPQAYGPTISARTPTGWDSSPEAWASTRGRHGSVARHSDLLGTDREADRHHAGFWDHGALLDADLCLTVAERAEEMGVKLRDLPSGLGLWAEPWTIEMRKEIEAGWGSRPWRRTV